MSDHTAYGQTGTPEEVPVCPRHPDRPSYVRCQRCHRPTCPECQRPAAVGVQCVDCVAEGARTVRTGRTTFGGAVTDGRPVVMQTIVAICVAVYVGQWLIPGFTGRIAFVPFIGPSEPWRFLTAAFAHSPSSIMHIAFNMYALWFMGTYLEPLLGRARFLALYLLSAFGGSVGFLALANPATVSWFTPTVGASGAVFGLFGAFLVLQRRLGGSATGMVATIAINAVLGFVIPGIAWQAHLGGLVTGAAAAAVIAYAGRSRRVPGGGAPSGPAFATHWLGLGAIAVVLVVIALAKYALA